MGVRFRKSVKMGPVRVNFSKSGIGYSVGTKGARITKKANGNLMTTASIPGTGLSYVKETSNKRKTSSITNTYTTSKVAENNFSYIRDKRYPCDKIKFWGWRTALTIFTGPIILPIIAMSFPILLIPLIIWMVRMGSTYKRPFEKIKQPVNFTQFTCDINVPESVYDLTGLTKEGQLALCSIVYYSEEHQNNPCFTLNELNSFENLSVSKYFLNTLFDLGFLSKREGKYHLNAEKYNHYVREYNSLYKEKEKKI